MPGRGTCKVSSIFFSIYILIDYILLKLKPGDEEAADRSDTTSGCETGQSSESGVSPALTQRCPHGSAQCGTALSVAHLTQRSPNSSAYWGTCDEQVPFALKKERFALFKL